MKVRHDRAAVTAARESVVLHWHGDGVDVIAVVVQREQQRQHVQRDFDEICELRNVAQALIEKLEKLSNKRRHDVTTRNPEVASHEVLFGLHKKVLHTRNP